jgi:hypothetical protein
MNPNSEWNTALATRAEQLVHLARYTAVNHITPDDLDLQHAVIHNLFVHTEKLQSLVYNQEGYNVPWNAATSYTRLNTELARLEGPPRQPQEMDLLIEKRKEVIRDIVLTLISPVTKATIELDRHKLINLAHINRELRPLLINEQSHQVVQATHPDILEQAMNLHVERV